MSKKIVSNQFFHWENIDLISVGTFAALIRVSTYLITICGGGMNPIAFIIKNTIITSLVVVLCHKVPRFGVLTLYSIVTYLFSLIIAGSFSLSIPVVLCCSLLGDCFIYFGSKINQLWSILLAVIFYELGTKLIGILYSLLFVREDIRLLIVPAIVVSIGCIGSFIGLFFGVSLLKELRHAGIIRK